MGVLRHELPDQHVLDHRIIASYGLIAPLVTMSCRLLLRRVASPGALPRERFSPMGPCETCRDVRLESVICAEADLKNSLKATRPLHGP
jgi:hypothetical protein